MKHGTWKTAIMGDARKAQCRGMDRAARRRARRNRRGLGWSED